MASFEIHRSINNTHNHSNDHTHSQDHGHSHEHMESKGDYLTRAPQLTTRNWAERAFTIGIGGPVGSGKTALMLALCQHLYPKYNIGCVTNDIFTKEDAEFLIKHHALPADRIRAVETGKIYKKN